MLVTDGDTVLMLVRLEEELGVLDAVHVRVPVLEADELPALLGLAVEVAKFVGLMDMLMDDVELTVIEGEIEMVGLLVGVRVKSLDTGSDGGPLKFKGNPR